MTDYKYIVNKISGMSSFNMVIKVWLVKKILNPR